MWLQITRPNARTASILLLSLSQLSCAFASSVEGRCAKVGYEFFYDIARAQREFEGFALEKKYDVLICAMQGTHPPRLEFASFFANEGERGAVLLREHLLEPTDDLTVRDIGYTLLRIQELGKYDVRSDHLLMTKLEMRVNEMKNGSWRKVALDNLMRLRDGPTGSSEKSRHLNGNR